MTNPELQRTLSEFVEGRTDSIFDLVAAGLHADHKDEHGVALIGHCAYYGDVSAIRFLLAQGESLDALGENLALDVACFHGHWRLAKFLLERGADVNHRSPDTGETPLHSALCNSDRMAYDRVLAVLLTNGANPNVATIPGVETGAFMRDCRTKGRNAAASRRGLRRSWDHSTAEKCRRSAGRKGRLWRHAAFVGQLVWAPDSHPPRTAPRKLPHPSAEPAYAREPAGKAVALTLRRRCA